VDPLPRRGWIGHETKQSAGHMQNVNRHKSPALLYTESSIAWRWRLLSIECVCEIQFHQHMIWRQCNNCWIYGCLATSWCTGSKLIWIEIFPESVNAKGICALRDARYRSSACTACRTRYCFTNSVRLSNTGVVFKRLYISSNLSHNLSL